MNIIRRIRLFFARLTRKRRLSLRKQHNGKEIWYMHITSLEMIGSGIAVLLLMFIAILTLVAFTPILNLIPGYSGNRTRTQVIENIIKVDSIQRRLDELQVYYSNVALIMEGKTPIIRDVLQAGDSLTATKAETVPPSREDSLLRAQFEGDGELALSNVIAARQQVRPGIELMAPVRGVVTERFDPAEGRYGVRVATGPGEQILAVTDGTVIAATWSLDEGYVIQLQHPDNLVSVYRNGVVSLVRVGTRVRSGEVISATAEGDTPDILNTQFEFELWQNGSAVDPENFIVF
ncbi:MAG: M23 family metallopeptidase [Alistipes sp.]|nr:M23 family metallopeptidase [Alistipes sp.]